MAQYKIFRSSVCKRKRNETCYYQIITCLKCIYSVGTFFIQLELGVSLKFINVYILHTKLSPLCVEPPFSLTKWPVKLEFA